MYFAELVKSFQISLEKHQEAQAKSREEFLRNKYLREMIREMERKKVMGVLGRPPLNDRLETEEESEGVSIDLVNSPPHYTTGQYEVIDILQDKLSKEEFKGFLKGNVLKYLFRSDKKGNEQQDIEKAQWYLNRLINKKENILQLEKEMD